MVPENGPLKSPFYCFQVCTVSVRINLIKLIPFLRLRLLRHEELILYLFCKVTDYLIDGKHSSDFFTRWEKGHRKGSIT